MYIKNGKIVLKDRIIDKGVLQIEGDRITAVGEENEIKIHENAEVIDAKGFYVGPGFVDIHTHGGGGYMFYANPEEAAKHFLSHGETTVLPTLYYDLTKEELISAVNRIKDAMLKGEASKAIGGIYMEGPYMNPKYGASPDKNKWRGEIKSQDYTPLVDRLGDLVKVWVIAPERQGLKPFAEYAKKVNPKVVFSVGHSEANYSQIMEFKEYGLNLVTHCMNATGRVSEFKGTRGFGPDETCMLEKDMYAELICDSKGIHVNSDLQRLLISVKGKDKVVLISDSFVTEENAPDSLKHITDLSFDENGNLCGSKLTLDVACKNIIKHTSCSMADAFLMASFNPSKVIGMDNEIGSIEAEKKANLVFVDDAFIVEKVMLNGKVI